jgi:GR25 family glycosyltransferase involved in LPS biosynthesis
MLGHTGLNNKLESFGPIYVINLKDRKDRKDFMLKQFKSHGIKDFTFIDAIDGNTHNMESDVIKFDTLTLTMPELGASMSHLIAIKTWLETSDSDHAIIMEDDVSFETVEYWDFNWSEFLKNINKKYDILQMCIIHNININTNTHLKEINDWSAGAYLIKREYAEKLIKKHYLDNKFNFYLDKKSVADFLVYYTAKTYSTPLFVTNLKLNSSINQNHILQSHTRSYNQITEFWKSKNSEIQEKTTDRGYMSYYKNDLEFTKFLSINKIYEQDLIENHLLSIIKNASTILDIGAHCGSHTVVYKSINSNVKIHSFEPQEKLFELLSNNVLANNLSDITLYSNSFGESEQDITIDSLSLDSCDYIKIDLQGKEQVVIQGAKETIEKFKPSIMFKHNPENPSGETLKTFDATKISDIFKDLEDFGYTISCIDGNGNHLAIPQTEKTD